MASPTISTSSPPPAASLHLTPATYPVNLWEFWDAFLFMGWNTTSIIASAFIIIPLVVGMVAARIFLRLSAPDPIHDRLNLGDWLMIIGCIITVISQGFAVCAGFHGIGSKEFQIDWYQPLWGCKWIVLWSYSYTFATGPIKVSVCLARLGFCSSKSWYTNTLVMLIALSCINPLFQIGWELMACVPISYVWDQVTQSGKCFPVEWTVGSIYGYAVVSIIIDATLAIVSGFLLSTLQMRIADKWMTGILLVLGSLSAICTVIRMPWISGFNDLGYWIDGFYYKLGHVVLASQWELAFSICGGCIGVVKQIKRRRNAPRHARAREEYYIKRQAFLSKKARPTIIEHRKDLMCSTIIEGGYDKQSIDFLRLEDERIENESRLLFQGDKIGLKDARGEYGDGILVTTITTVTHEDAATAGPLARPTIEIGGRFLDIYLGGHVNERSRTYVAANVKSSRSSSATGKSSSSERASNDEDPMVDPTALGASSSVEISGRPTGHTTQTGQHNRQRRG